MFPKLTHVHAHSALTHTHTCTLSQPHTHTHTHTHTFTLSHTRPLEGRHPGRSLLLRNTGDLLVWGGGTLVTPGNYQANWGPRARRLGEQGSRKQGLEVTGFWGPEMPQVHSGAWSPETSTGGERLHPKTPVSPESLASLMLGGLFPVWPPPPQS